MRPGAVGLVVLWATATAVLTTTAWLAVEVVADEVGGVQTQVLSPAAVRAAVDAASPSPLVSASASPAPQPSRSPSATPRPLKTPTSTPSPTGSKSSSPRPSGSKSSSPKPSGSGGGASTVSKTFAVQGGTVAASCTGSSVSLKSAQPQDGWRVEVHDRGPEHLEITFGSGEQETEVKVRCSGGSPVLEVHEDDGESDD